MKVVKIVPLTHKFFMRRLFLIPLTLFALMMLASGQAMAKTLEVPINFDTDFLTELVKENVFKKKQGLSVWGDDVGCNDLTLSNPQIIVEEGALYVITDGRAVTGWAIGKKCLNVVRWQGKIKAKQRTDVVNNRGIIRFTTEDTELLNRDGEAVGVSRKLWNIAKKNVHPHLDTLSIDLTRAVDEVREMLPLFFSYEYLARSNQLINSLHLDTLTTNTESLNAIVRFEVDVNPLEMMPLPSNALTEQELALFIETWQRWDAFLSFIVKIAARNTLELEHKEKLLETLLETRYTLVDVLSKPDAANTDSIRQSFISAWTDLSPIFRDIPHNMQGRESLRFLSFIAATDALKIIDDLGPVTGWDVSIEGLRRLARILIDDPNIDPLEINPDVDPELRQLFDFGPALIPRAPSSQIIQPSWFENLIAELLISPAHAEEAKSGVDNNDRGFVVQFTDLNELIANRKNLGEYLPLIKTLLHDTVDGTLWLKPLDEEYHTLYRNLVLTTAWQETCWRQYRLKDNAPTVITSSAGALGMMQIMPRVWRGFYNTDSLGNSIVYNAIAGSEILHRYLTRYAIRKGEHEQDGGLENLARASYAAYNGGPRHLKRYRLAGTKNSLQKIDKSFWKKYQQVRDGDELAVRQCFGITGTLNS